MVCLGILLSTNALTFLTMNRIHTILVVLVVYTMWSVPGFTQSKSAQLDSLFITLQRQGSFNGNVLVAEKGRREEGEDDHMLIVFGLARRSQPATSIRVKVTAVNTLVAMPISSTTAKPFTGPEPSTSMMTPEIACVTFASKIVRLASL